MLQLPELQEEQELPPLPGTVLGMPLDEVLKTATVLMTGLADFWHLGQQASLPAWLRGRNTSNLLSHSLQTNSYNGIVILLITVYRV